MKKFNVRISAIGGTLLLISIAFAVAQQESRKRTRIAEEAKQAPAQPAVPIAFETSEPAWHQTPDSRLTPIVRGNDNELLVDTPASLQPEIEAYSPASISENPNPNPGEEPNLGIEPALDNPLRGSAQAYAVVTAAGEEPAARKMPATPPAWLKESLPATASQAPAPNTIAPASNLPSAGIPPLPTGSQLPSTQLPSAQTPSAQSPGAAVAATASPFAASPGAMTMPAFPMGTSNPSTSNPPREPLPTKPAGTALPAASATGIVPNTGAPASLANGLGGQAGLPASSYGMSDTQRGAMPPTGFPATMPSSNANNGAANPLPRENTPSNYGGPSSFNSPPVPNNSGRTPAALTSLVSNEPGNRYLDGSQNPIMLIQKRGPEEVRVGKKTTFVITIRNAGNSTAQDVTVVDSIPLGMRFSEANPPVNPTADGLLTWKLGEMPAGDERTINLQMIPERQGELGSVASVHFTAQASLRTVATQPKLEIQIDAQSESLIGAAQLIAVTVKNVGTGVARGVSLEADLPAQLRHESGDQHLEAIFPSELAPNQSQRIELRSTAAQPGDGTCVIRALTEDGAEAQQQVPITVLSPALVAAIEGPRLRYLDRQATYRFKIQNTGTAPATNLKFIVRLPSGLRFNASDNNLANYNPADHTVELGLQELPIETPAVFELTVLPVERGTQVLTLNATADLGISTEAKGQVAVEGLAELAFTIGQDNGTIETGSSSTYTVQVTNIGNNPDKDVRLAVQLPAGAQVLKVDAPVRYSAEGNQILFEPIPEMRNKDQHTFRFEVRHTQAGSLIVRTQLTSANWPVAVVKEEGTLVYDDQN